VAAFGGASRSLCELIRNFPEGAVKAYVITQKGDVAGFFAEAGAEVLTTRGITQLDNTRFGHYRGMRWLLLLRELCYVPFTLAALLRARARWKDIEIVHVNEIVALLPIFLAKHLFRAPVVAHVRSVQSANWISLRSRLVARVLHRNADAVICIDETVKASLPRELEAEVIHNSFTPQSTALDPTPASRFRVGMVGNLLAFKGTTEFIEAARICRDRGLDIEFIVVGSNPRALTGVKGWILRKAGFARDVEEELKNLIAHHHLDGHVRLGGFIFEVSKVYRNLDVLCFPSHLDAVGRPVYEAAFWKVPSIVAVNRPQPDTIVPGKTGLCIAPRDPAALADAIIYYYEHPEERKRMGEAAYHLATTNFDGRKNALKVFSIYRRLLGKTGEDDKARCVS